MTKRLMIFLLAATASLTFSCGGGSDWTAQPLDVAADATFSGFLQDAAALSGLTFTVEEELQANLDANPVDLPTLQGATAAEALALVQDMMPPDTTFVYEKLADGNYLLRLRFEQAEDLSEADPAAFENFSDGLGFTAAALISDPQFEEICGGDPEGTVLQLLGDGGIFEVAVEVDSDPAGHSEFIGTFPPSVEVQIDGNAVTVIGESPWVAVAGTIADDGSFTCSGSGVVAGFPDVSVTFEGAAAPGDLSGTLVMGAGGELPGGEPAVYAVHP